MVQPWGRIDIWQKSRINYICESRSYKKTTDTPPNHNTMKASYFFGVCFIFHDSTNMDKNLPQQSVAKIQRTFVTPHCPKSIVALIFKSQAFYGGEIPNSPLWPTAFNCQWDGKQWNIPLVPCLEKIGLKSTYLFICSGVLSYSVSLTWKVK